VAIPLRERLPGRFATLTNRFCVWYRFPSCSPCRHRCHQSGGASPIQSRNALTEKSIATADRGDRPINFVNFTAKNAMMARYVLERADWAGAAALPFTATQYPQPDSLIRFTRGLGMARSGDLAGAKGEIEAIKALRAALERANQSYWADRSEEQVLAISAWIALKEDAREQAIKLMRAAADGEEGSVKHVAMENRLYSMRELYAELLLETGQPAAALHEFETALEQTPNRYRVLLGIARNRRPQACDRGV
jgi:tetratricopeptide (TPR) repeat protein